MELHFYPIDIDYIDDKDENPVIRLFGRAEDNKRVCVIDRGFRPYFWAVLRENASEKRAKELIEKVEKVEMVEFHDKKFLAKKVRAAKITVDNPKNLGSARRGVQDVDDIENVYETDINFVRRYLVDKKITPLTLCKAIGKEVDANADVDLVLEAEEIIQESDEAINPRILAFDIEVYNPFITPRENEDPIIMLAFYGKNFKKVLTWKNIKGAGKEVEVVNDEASLLRKFVEIVRWYKPDYLVGYFSDGFDFPYIKARADKYKIKLNLGLDYSSVAFSKRTELRSARIRGFAHVDIYRFIRRMTWGGEIQLERYDLDTVSKEMLGEGKAEADLMSLAETWDKHPEKLKGIAEYNLKDSELTYRLAEKMLPNLHEMVKLVGQIVYDVSRMSFGQLVEWYMIKQLGKFNELIPNRPHFGDIEERERESYEGAFVYEPSPGIYENIMGFDFRSLYPSIIISHNICLSTITKEKKDSFETPEIEKQRYYFTKKHRGFIPEILKEIVERRAGIKQLIKKAKKIDPILNARQNGLKILANAFYGYFGFSGARWYSNESAASITAWARYYILTTIDRFEKTGFKVLYSDTDSLYITLDKKKGEGALNLMEKINKELPEAMELELENFYKRGVFVMKKGEKKGAKKKYALIDKKNKIKIRGFETVRGDWSVIAREAQEDVLRMILKDNDKEKAVRYVKNIIKQIREKKISKDKMIIRKQLKKKIESYEAVGPHVIVAKRMKERGIGITVGALISYIIDEGKGMIRDKAKMPDESKNYDAEYYINNQVLPAVMPLLEVIGVEEEKLKKDHKQKGITDF